MSYYDNKPKNDYDEKPKYGDYQTAPERGGCLTVFLVLGFVANLLAIPAALYLQSQINDLSGSPYISSSQLGFVQMMVWVSIVGGIAGVACIGCTNKLS